MISFFKRLMRDPRGNAILIAGAAMPVVIGAAGLATDTTQWVLWKRQLQRAADSAALAGAYAKSQSDSASTAVATDLVNNNQAKNQSGINLSAGYPQIAYPTSPDWSYGVQVSLAIQKKLSFSSLFMATAPVVTATATAALVDAGDYCVVALEKTTAVGITVGGNSNTTLGCGAISNSRNQNSAVAANGSAYNFTADPVAAVGGLAGCDHRSHQPAPVSHGDARSVRQPVSDLGSAGDAVQDVRPACQQRQHRAQDPDGRLLQQLQPQR